MNSHRREWMFRHQRYRRLQQTQHLCRQVFQYVHWRRVLLRLLSNGSTGRFFKRASKQHNVEGSVAKAATGIMKRNVAPDSPQSIGSLELVSVFAPSIVQQPSATWFTFAPKAVISAQGGFSVL